MGTALGVNAPVSVMLAAEPDAPASGEQPECVESWTGYLVGLFADVMVVWPVGTIIRKKVSYLESFSARDICALPSAIGLGSWVISDYLQDGTIACWPWYQAVGLTTVVGLALQS